MSAFAQNIPKKEQRLRTCIKDFDTALVQNDQKSLERLLHKQLNMGHSNGLVENKTELTLHLQNTYLSYQSIDSIGSPSIQFTHHTATVRRKIQVKGALQGKAFEVKLLVLETWLKRKGSWQLLNRQSTKIN